MKSQLASVLVEDIMTRTQVSVGASQSVHLADALMSARGLQHLPVVDEDNNLLGLVSHRDILAADLGNARQDSRADESDDFSHAAPGQEGLLRPVATIMTSEVVTLTKDMNANTAAGHLLRSRHGFAPVLDGTGLVGILTEEDALRLCIQYFRTSPMLVADLMTRELVTATGDTSIEDAIVLMEDEDIHHLLICNMSGQLKGLVSHRDVLMLQRSLAKNASKQSWTIAEVASKTPWTTTSQVLACEAALTLLDNHFGCLPVVEKKHLLGIVTLSDLLTAIVSDDRKKAPEERYIAPCGAYTAKSICRVAPEQSIARAFQCFSQYSTPTLLVVESDTAVGILSHKDVLKAMHESDDVDALLASPLSNYMSRELVRIDGNSNVDKAAALLTQERVHQVVVEHDDAPPGLLGATEILQAVRDLRVKTPLREFMSTILFSIDSKESVKSARRYLRQAELSGLIVNDGKWPVGIFGQPEALASLNALDTDPVETTMCSKIVCLPQEMPASRAAEQAEALGARHIIVQGAGETVGLATATDFASLLARTIS